MIEVLRSLESTSTPIKWCYQLIMIITCVNMAMVELCKYVIKLLIHVGRVCLMTKRELSGLFCSWCHPFSRTKTNHAF